MLLSLQLLKALIVFLDILQKAAMLQHLLIDSALIIQPFDIISDLVITTTGISRYFISETASYTENYECYREFVRYKNTIAENQMQANILFIQEN